MEQPCLIFERHRRDRFRREWLDWLIPLGKPDLRQVLAEQIRQYNDRMRLAVHDSRTGWLKHV